jgi:hypothetical protein
MIYTKKQLVDLLYTEEEKIPGNEDFVKKTRKKYMRMPEKEFLENFPFSLEPIRKNTYIVKLK